MVQLSLSTGNAVRFGKIKSYKRLIVIGLMVIGFWWSVIYFVAGLLSGNLWALVPAVGLMLLVWYVLKFIGKSLLWLGRNQEKIKLFTNICMNLLTFFAYLTSRSDYKSQAWAGQFLLPPDEFERRLKSF